MHLVPFEHDFLPKATQQTTFSNISFEDAQKSLWTVIKGRVGLLCGQASLIISPPYLASVISGSQQWLKMCATH
jgi:hypothetical protein